jgi:hypothetical protein
MLVGRRLVAKVPLLYFCGATSKKNIEGKVNKEIYLVTRNMTFDSCFVIGRWS